MDFPLISVIVPIYNVEKYIDECLNSILNQTMKDFEVILVDDGSPDNCGKICDEYANRYENFHAFHKENGGLSDARNYGIEKANGEYLIFIDSDDFYDDVDFFQKIKSAIGEYNHPTAISFSNKTHNSLTSEIRGGKYLQNSDCVNNIISYEELLRYLIKEDSLSISACLKAIKRSFLIENNLFFKKGIYCEDIEWSMRLYAIPLTIKFIESDAYVYRIERVGSITHSMNKKNLMDLAEIIDTYANEFLKSNNEICSLLLNYLAYQYSILCGLIFRIKNRAERKQIFNYIVKNKWLLKHTLSSKVKMVGKIYSFLGIRNTVFVLCYYIKHRR